MITKQGDTKITFSHTPTINDVPVLPADLAGCTLKFILRIADDSLPAIERTATINPDATFSYQPIPADVATIGKYRQEWEVTYPDNKELTFPNNGYNIVKILESLNLELD